MNVEAPSDPPRPRARLPFEQNPFGGAAQTGAILLYGALAAVCAGVAMFMVFQGRQLASGYVAAPAIGALWFALRFLMQWGRRR